MNYSESVSFLGFCRQWRPATLLGTAGGLGLASILTLATGAVGLSEAREAENIGAAIGITNRVIGSHGPETQQMLSGDPVFENHTIQTGTDSLAQIEFADETNLAVSENSSIEITRHVYDPNEGTGEIALNAVGGAFRFVTGLVPKENISINTPTATLGVRGTTFDLYVHENGEAAITLVEGEVEVCNARQACRLLSTVGKVMHITVDGVISEAREWGDNLVGGVQYAAAFPFSSSSKRVLRKAFYAPGVAADNAARGGKKVLKSGQKTGQKAGKAVVKGGKKAGKTVSRTSKSAVRATSRTGRKANRAVKRTGRKAVRGVKRLLP